MWIAIDDTDSIDGMCTTYLAVKLCERLGAVGLPRLVRLNPNIPYKTRGNGAVAFRTDYVKPEETVLSYVEKHAMLEDEGTNPGIAFMDDGEPNAALKGFYRKTVTELVGLEEAERVALASGVRTVGLKNRRGIIGAVAALGFHGPVTYELIAYRAAGASGRRMIDKASVVEMNRLLYPESFDNLDLSGRRVLITPRGRDPVFSGIRGLSPKVVRKAWSIVKPLEDVETTMVFETNHATDAHLTERTICSLKPYDCASLKGAVASRPRRIAGGHVIFRLSDETGAIDCAVYKPGKALTDYAMRLVEGDEVVVHGGIGRYAGTLNVEKFEVKTLSETVAVDAQMCCGKRMTSAGSGKGHKCKKCGKRVSHDSGRVSQGVRGILEGVYDAPPGSRRHLSKPAYLYPYIMDRR